MGKSESANVSIGLKIKLGDLIEQINVENIEELKKIFSGGFIEDKNEEFSNMFIIVYSELYNEFFIPKRKGVCKKKTNEQNQQNEEKTKDESTKNLEEENKINKINEFKLKFIEESKNNGSRKEYRCSEFGEFGGYISTLEKGCLYEQFLLYPVTSLLKTDRWGDDREGTNSSSCELDFDIEEIKNNIKEKYDFIQGFKVVMMIKQHSC